MGRKHLASNRESCLICWRHTDPRLFGLFNFAFELLIPIEKVELSLEAMTDLRTT